VRVTSLNAYSGALSVLEALSLVITSVIVVSFESKWCSSEVSES
jgi:hypothetical protein